MGIQIRRKGFNEMALTRSWSSRFEWRQSTPLLLQTHRWATQELPDSRILWCVRQRLCRSRLSLNRTLHWRSRSQPYGIQDPSRSNQETDHASIRVDGSKPTGKINRLHSTSLHVAKGYSWGYTVGRFVYNIVLDQEQQGLETVRPTSSQWDTRTDEQAPMEALPWGVKPRRLALSRMFRSRAQEKWNLVDRTSFSEISRRAMATDPQPTSKDKEQAFAELIKHPPMTTHSLASLSSSTHGSVYLEKLIDPQRYSTKTKMLRVTAIVLRFTRNLRKKEPSPKMLELLAEELIEAEEMWIRCIQASAFQAEIWQLAIGGTNPMVKQLGLFIDTDNIVRCEGRISQSTFSESAKQPILLPSKHRFTELVIREKHEVVHHDGIKEILNCVREKYWILRGREAVKRVVTKCVTCKKFQGKTFATSKEPPLPSSRVSDDPPFSNTGIDFAGPLYTSDNGLKVYICLLRCASTRAVHLELVDSLSVPAFLQAFRRFAARRGLPARLISDNARTFKSAAREVKSIGRSTENVSWRTRASSGIS